jgi:hypothetical protein
MVVYHILWKPPVQDQSQSRDKGKIRKVNNRNLKLLKQRTSLIRRFVKRASIKKKKDFPLFTVAIKRGHLNLHFLSPLKSFENATRREQTARNLVLHVWALFNKKPFYLRT